jgi:stress response protein SCP2
MERIDLAKGQNLAIDPDLSQLRIVLEWSFDSDPVDLDVVALLLGEQRKVRSDADLIFYNQSASADGAVVLAAKALNADQGSNELMIDLDVVAADVHCIAVAASCEGAVFGDLTGASIGVHDPAGGARFHFALTGLSTERAVVMGEIYRRDDGWKFRAIGQGWDSGLAGLATDFGIEVDDTPAVDGDVAEIETDETAAPDVAEPTDETAPVVADVETPRVEMPAPTSGRRRPVQVKAAPAKTAVPRRFVLGLEPTWQPARLFSIAGIGSTDEQEKRATSALMWVLAAVRPFARVLTARAGAPAGTVETFLEVPFTVNDRRVIPDGVIRVARGQKSWTALVEVKTGAADLRKEQVENYLQVARKRNFDAVVTISNDLVSDLGGHPVEVSAKSLGKVQLVHISWSEIMHELRLLLAHHPFQDELSVWIVAELLRYLEHPRSGALAFHDMGPAWVPVRESVASGTLALGDRKAGQVVEAWLQLSRQLGLGLTSRLGVVVKQVVPRRLSTDPAARVREAVTALADAGVLSVVYKVPGAAGQIEVRADLRASKIFVSIDVQAPAEGTPRSRVVWLTRQLKEAPDRTVVETHFEPGTDVTKELLGAVREHSTVVLPRNELEPQRFTLVLTSPLGPKRSGAKGGFVESVTSAVEEFYVQVAEKLRPWTPPAPQLDADGPVEGEPADPAGD